MNCFYRPHPRVQLDCGDELITKQNHKQECDINHILKQYQRTGIINHITQLQPTFQDLPDQIDYQESLNLIMDAQQTFDALPAKVRAEFDNDPARFLAAFTDPAKEDYLRENGFLKPKEPASAVPATSIAAPANDAA